VNVEQRPVQRCLPSVIGWLHIRPHRGCPQQELELPSADVWSDPTRDIAADVQRWVSKRMENA